MTQEDGRQLPHEQDLGQKAVEAEGEGKRLHRRESTPRRSFAASALFALGTAAALGLLTLDPAASPGRQALEGGWILFVGLIGFLILRTGRVSRWRALLFAVVAWGFVLHFKADSLGLRQTALRTPEIQEVPYCHIAIASSILNYAYAQYLAVKSGHWARWGPLSSGVLWLAVTLVLGQAWCSWGCFYGGLDEGFSRVLRKPWIRWFSLPGRLRELPAAILLVSALLSFASLLPVFCLWVCPLKITTAFLDPDTTVRKIQLALFVLSGTLAIVVLPVLAKKRVFCGLICPFGAWQAFWGSVNPFRVTIRPELCNQCQLCLKACPTFAIEREALRSHTIGPYCNRCGECVDVCPTGAIAYTVLHHEIHPAEGGPPSPLGELWDGRVLFLFAALLMCGAIGGLFIPDLLGRGVLALGVPLP